MNSKTTLHLLTGFIIGITSASQSQAANLAISDSPLFLSSVPPNVMVMLDNSGSMKEQMYTSSYNNSTDYYGIFEAGKNYIYDTTIPVNASAYKTTVDTSKTGAFVESNCTPSIADTTCWSGRYLNWLTTKRIDSSRQVLVGGKLESTTSYNYGANLNYKVVANNEHADRIFTEANANSASYSPIPNGVTVTVMSPANTNSGSIQAAYDPYAKIYGAGGASFIYNSAGNKVGEYGSADINASVDGSGDLDASSWVTVNFAGTYASAPVVVAKPPTYNGADPGVVRIKDVTSSGFKISFQEWNYRDGNHTTETINYMALKAGHHNLAGGSLSAQAGKVNTDKTRAAYCAGATNQSESVTFNNSMTNPLVIASVTTYSGSDAVNARVWNVGNNGFETAMQEEEDEGGHAAEDISWIAIEQGTVNDTTNTPNWMLESATVSNVNDSDKTVNFTSTFNSTPFVIAGMQTVNDADPAVLRLKDSDNSSFKTFVEEEKSCNNEVGHSNENIGYIALSGTSELNIALAVKDKPKGLLHDIKDKVRLGISFYRYDPAVNDIYNGNTIQGGTLKFKIPLNPFVKKPSDTALPSIERGYREQTGYIGTDIDDVVDAINNYPLVWGTTPLAENLWEVIQYFEQDDPYYADVASGFKDFDKADASNPTRDPYYYPSYNKKLECAKSSVIIFTDGEPYKDADIPAAIVDYDDDSDADDVGSTAPNTQGKDNLDDVAYWAYCDKSSTATCSTTAGGTRDLRSDIINLVDINNRPITQNLKTYTVGFANGNITQILQDTADNGGGTAYAAEDGASLKNALEQAFSAAIDDSSASAVTVTTGSITGNSAVFQARFNSNDWSGELLAYPINSDGSVGTAVNASIIPGATNGTAATTRKIITYNGSSGVPFQWPANPASPTASEINLSQVTSLNSDQNVLNYLRGDQSMEEQNGGTFRDRNKLLGDMINASPSYVSGTTTFSYPDSLETASHSTFKTSLEAMNSGAGRTPTVYAGANDGMLHAFNAKVTDTNNDGIPEFPTDFGKELFAYIPKFLYGKLADLSSPSYAHQYTADGSPTIGDAFFDSTWHTVLVAGANAGGQGIYALDITDPSDFASEASGKAKVLWEFTDADDDGDHTDGNLGEKGDRDLGYTFSQPNIVRMANGVWAAVFGNGYNNTEADSNTSVSGNAVLYIVNIKTGELIKKLDTGVGTAAGISGGRPNGLATVAPVDTDNDHIVDAIYGGDLYGNLWKFNVDNVNPNQWAVDYSGDPLFTACAGTCTTSNRQPITVRPQVGLKQGNLGYMVYFGTGQYLETTDNQAGGQLTQTFYGIWDKDLPTLTPFTRSNLLSQEIEWEFSEFGFELRVTSDHQILNSHLGWYMDLYNANTDATQNPTGANYGERQVSNPILRNGRIIFTTLIPSDDPCEVGGTGWLMELDAHSGSRLPYSPFDLNADGVYDIYDYATTIDLDGDGTPDPVPTSGKKSKVGIINSPGIISATDSTTGAHKEYKYNSGSTGDIEVTSENPGVGSVGRQSWNRLDF